MPETNSKSRNNIIGHKSCACVFMIYIPRQILNNLHSLHHASSVAQKKPKVVGCNLVEVGMMFLLSPCLQASDSRIHIVQSRENFTGFLNVAVVQPPIPATTFACSEIHSWAAGLSSPVTFMTWARRWVRSEAQSKTAKSQERGKSAWPLTNNLPVTAWVAGITCGPRVGEGSGVSVALVALCRPCGMELSEFWVGG